MIGRLRSQAAAWAVQDAFSVRVLPAGAVWPQCSFSASQLTGVLLRAVSSHLLDVEWGSITLLRGEQLSLLLRHFAEDMSDYRVETLIRDASTFASGVDQ